VESSIPEDLRCPRTRARRVRDDYAPPYPAWVARASKSIRQVTMAYFGVQWKDSHLAAQANAQFAQLTAYFAAADGAAHFDRAVEIDAAGFTNLIAIAYWTDTTAFSRWQADSKLAEWWESRAAAGGRLGYFRETFSPRIERFETLFSSPDRMEGIGVALQGRSEQDVMDHAYWGSMRDRIPLSQTDALEASGGVIARTGLPASQRLRIAGHENLAIIRSGQEWTDTEGRERALYTTEMEPILRAGMVFLRDHGSQIGCYVNRYMQHVDASGQPLQKTFGLSYWRSLAQLEHWAEFHPTHLAIFGTFMRIVKELEFNLKLRLYHEVAVLSQDEQDYEYINCHAGSGLLRACNPG
jgi:aldoxime dehydratase